MKGVSGLLCGSRAAVDSSARETWCQRAVLSCGREARTIGVPYPLNFAPRVARHFWLVRLLRLLRGHRHGFVRPVDCCTLVPRQVDARFRAEVARQISPALACLAAAGRS